jgi:hypothetical protein
VILVPVANAAQVAKLLDGPQLRRQRADVGWALRALVDGVPVRGGHVANVKQWAGHVEALAVFGMFMCVEMHMRGEADLAYYWRMHAYRDGVHQRRRMFQHPPWWGDPAVHAAHREIMEKEQGWEELW